MIAPRVVIISKARVSAGFIRVSRRMRNGRQVCRVYDVGVRGRNKRCRLGIDLRRGGGIGDRSLPGDHVVGDYRSWNSWQQQLKPVHMARPSRASIAR